MDILEKLKSFRITKAYIKNGRCYVFLEGFGLPTKRVRIVEHCAFVGQNQNIPQDRIHVDNNIAEEKLHELFVSIHETLENWIQKIFLSDKTNKEAYPPAHKITQEIEKRYIVAKYGMRCYKRYNDKVEKVWNMENG